MRVALNMSSSFLESESSGEESSASALLDPRCPTVRLSSSIPYDVVAAEVAGGEWSDRLSGAQRTLVLLQRKRAMQHQRRVARLAQLRVLCQECNQALSVILAPVCS